MPLVGCREPKLREVRNSIFVGYNYKITGSQKNGLNLILQKLPLLKKLRYESNFVFVLKLMVNCNILFA